MKKLPDAEFDVMKVVWANAPPITANIVMKHLAEKKGWTAAPTAITLLLRLVERGFLRTEKNGKEREYYPLIEREEYLKFETQNFMEIYHDNSFVSFVSALYDNGEISEADVKEIVKIIKERGE